jgi:hypothetical protein
MNLLDFFEKKRKGSCTLVRRSPYPPNGTCRRSLLGLNRRVAVLAMSNEMTYFAC